MSIGSDIDDKITSWFKFDGDLTDAKGVNDLDTGIVVAGYSTGLQGQQLDIGSRAYCTLASPLAINLTDSNFFLGGWMDFAGGATLQYLMGFTFDTSTSTCEAYYFGVDGTGHVQCAGWPDSSGIAPYLVRDPAVRQVAYPITVRCEDSEGHSATSDQIILIGDGTSNPPGRYFFVAQWANGVMSLYNGARLVATAAAPATVKAATAPYFQVGILGAVTGLTVANLDECFFGQSANLTQAQIEWLYNGGAGRTYADLSA